MKDISSSMKQKKKIQPLKTNYVKKTLKKKSKKEVNNIDLSEKKLESDENVASSEIRLNGNNIPSSMTYLPDFCENNSLSDFFKYTCYISPLSTLLKNLLRFI